MNDLVKKFFDNINKLEIEYVEFAEWKKDKVAEKIIR